MTISIEFLRSSRIEARKIIQVVSLLISSLIGEDCIDEGKVLIVLLLLLEFYPHGRIYNSEKFEPRR